MSPRGLQYTREPAARDGPLHLTNPLHSRLLLLLLLLIGTFLLLYKFPTVPIGLHQDEISEAYEGYALLHTGADRWGFHLPVYFLSWGSGQNVLQAYLTIPVLAITGLTRLSARFIPILCGVLTLPLFFLTVRRWCGDTTALLALLFLVLSPWHIMLSRWGTENSPLPFFLILGVYTFSVALEATSPSLIFVSLVPFALAIYTYGIMVVIVPILIPLLLLMRLPQVLRQRAAWLGALALFCLLALPLVYFTFKNYVLKTSFAFEHHLPFSIPLLPATRLSQARNEMTRPTVLGHNVHFIGKGLSDHAQWYMPWFQLPDVLPVQPVLLGLALLGIGVLSLRAFRTRKFNEPFLLWLLACTPLLFLIPLTISRSTVIFLPLLALAAIGCVQLFTWCFGRASRRPFGFFLLAVCAVAFLLPMFRFVKEYYGQAYAAEATPTFNPMFPAALSAALHLAPSGTPIYVTPAVSLNYVQVLFFTSEDPRTFQASGATFKQPDFGPYRFSRQTLDATPNPFVFLIKADDVVQWNVQHALDARLQPQPSSTAQDALQRWNTLLPPLAADSLHRQLNDIAAYSLPEVIKAEHNISIDDARRFETAPICSTPTQAVAIGQFLIGRCH